MPENDFIPVAAPVIGEREVAYVTDAVRSGWVSSIGPYIDRFEASFASYLGVRHAIAVCNGTVALHLALHALGIGPGDEVIVPDLTFVATAHTVLQVGATPVFVDVEPDTWCIDPRALERAITPRTKAIIPVHLYGHPADMDAVLEPARARALIVIEDAAEAHGASHRQRKAGSMGTVGAFSFYGNKVITTGEGGMLVTDNDELAARLRFLKDHGMRKERRYFHTELAFNYRMTNLQAALGLAQLEQIDQFIAKKRQIADWYRRELEGLADCTVSSERSGYRSVYWMTSVVLGVRRSRDAVMAKLREAGVDSRPFFVPMSELPHLAKFRRVGVSGDGCPESARLSRVGLNLPSGCGLSEEQVVRAARALRSALSAG
jgi:perosamine synthetase